MIDNGQLWTENVETKDVMATFEQRARIRIECATCPARSWAPKRALVGFKGLAGCDVLFQDAALAGEIGGDVIR